MHAVRDERIDAIIVSTFPEQRGSSGCAATWSAGSQSEAKLPVEHVVVEPARGRRPRSGSAHADATRHHGPPIANKSSRVDARVLGMFLFIASEAMLFGAFFTAYFFVRVVNPDAQPWPLPPFHLPVFVARREHGDPAHLELHDALGAPVDQARQPRRPEGRASCSRS